MISKNVAVTAGHCVYQSGHNGWATSIKVSPGKKGTGFWNNPYGSANCTNMHTSTRWTGEGGAGSDWGVIELDKDIGEKTGWFGLGYSSESVAGTRYTITGYPAGYQYHQYTMSGIITNCDNNMLYYQIDTTGGQSGSPIYSNNIVYGIHVNGENSNNENSGTRITQSLYNYMISVIE